MVKLATHPQRTWLYRVWLFARLELTFGMQFGRTLSHATALTSAAQEVDGTSVAAAATGNYTVHYLEEQKDIFMHYMPGRNLVVCSCAKCGSTSLWNYIYEKEFNRSFTSDGKAWVQDVHGESWKQKIARVNETERQEQNMRDAFSFVLVRDPKERLVSAWKSKYACEGGFHTDVDKRLYYVQQLRELSGEQADLNISCLELPEFMHVLSEVHRQGRQRYLNRHILPQSLGCFYQFPPERWSKVTTIRHPGAVVELARRFNTTDNQTSHAHQTGGQVMIGEETAKLLDTVTSTEYAMLAKYLTEPSSVYANASV